MVYNDTSATILERMRSKFGKRTADAFLSAYSDTYEQGGYSSDESTDNKVKMSFFGEAIAENVRLRAIPVTRKTVVKQTEEKVKADAGRPSKAHAKQNTRADKSKTAAKAEKKNNSSVKTEKSAKIKERKDSVQMKQKNNTNKKTMAGNPGTRPSNGTAKKRMNNSANKNAGNPVNRTMKDSARRTANNNTGNRTGAMGLYADAYRIGSVVKGMISKVKIPSSRRYVKQNVPNEVLVRGRSNIPGSRHAVIKTNVTKETFKSKFAKFIDSFRETHRAEHRIKKAPFPLAYATLVVVCSFMAMILIFSHSEVNEYEDMINSLRVQQTQLDDTA